MDKRWVRSFTLEKPTVFGLVLNPVAPHHILSLMRLDSPYFKDDADESIMDAITAALVLADDYEHSLQTYKRFAFSPFHQVVMLLRARGSRSQQAIEIISSHFSRCMHVPEIWTGSNDAKGRNINEELWPLRLVANCMKDLKMSYSEAMNCPITQSGWLLTLTAERSGAEIVDEDELNKAEENSAFKDMNIEQLKELMDHARSNTTCAA